MLWLVFGGCGSAIFAATFPQTGIGFLGVSLAFGLTVLTMIYALRDISGCHFNPAVSLGLLVAGRFSAKCFVPYVIAQVIGGILAGGMLHLIATGQTGFDINNGFATNGYGIHSPGDYSIISAFTAEIILTAFFLLIILGSTRDNAPASAAPVAIGLALTLVHFISIPITNASVKPARSTGVAVFAGGWAIDQLWLFWVAPLLGGVLGAFMKISQPYQHSPMNNRASRTRLTGTLNIF